MLTGVETAGIVLAVLPLFISAFEHYNDGLEPIKAFWDIDRLLPIQIRRLRNQHVHFEQTLRILLTQIVDSSEEVEDMIAAPNSSVWKTPEMQERLEQRLQESYNAYQDTILHMEEIMKRIAKDFKMDHSTRANRSNLEALLKTNTRPDGAFDFKRRIKFAMSGRKMKSLLDDLDECNKELERFTDKSERLVPFRKQIKNQKSNPLNGVRIYAKALYSVLCVGTDCHTSHKTRLRLERRINPPKSSRSLATRDIGDPCFTVSFFVHQAGPNSTISWTWQQAQIQVMAKYTTSLPISRPLPVPGSRSVEFNLPPPMPPRDILEVDQQSLQDLEDLCSGIRQAQARPPCFGFSLHPEGKLRGVYPVDRRSSSATGTINLQQMLAATASPSTDKFKMSRKERMNLAVVLASSYLQLQATPWLDDTWSKEDIVFDGDTTTTSLRPCNVEHPYISHDFRPPETQNTAHAKAEPATMLRLPGNPSLLSLGILLLELYTGQTFEEYRLRAAGTGPVFDNYMQQLQNLDLLSKWLNAEQEDLSAGFQSAVLHCIRSFFDPINNLSDEATFRQSVYEQVIVPLQEELHSFLGDGRRNI